jgi:hypothetical protein
MLALTRAQETWSGHPSSEKVPTQRNCLREIYLVSVPGPHILGSAMPDHVKDLDMDGPVAPVLPFLERLA